jgi:diguanylate cyclase (GGDEF)-like protein
VSRVATLAANVQPYDPVVARRAAAGVIAAFAVISFVATMSTQLSHTLTILVGYVYPSSLLVWSLVLMTVRRRWIDTCMIVNPLLATALICLLDIVTRDASAGGQIAFCAPVLYAASQLRITGAVIVLVTTIAAELVTVLLLKPLDEAVADAGNVSIVLVIITVVLVAAGNRQERLLRQVSELAAVDPLTGLVTRRVFDEAAKNALLMAGDRGVALVLVDIDNFKTVNDTYGHPVGDDALAHVADVLRGEVGPTDILCRLGGDELAVLSPGTGVDDAMALAERFVTAVRSSPLGHPDQDLQLTISSGVGCSGGPGIDLRDLYAAADASLYDAKRRGRNRAGHPVHAVTHGGPAPGPPAFAPPPVAHRDHAQA